MNTTKKVADIRSGYGWKFLTPWGSTEGNEVPGIAHKRGQTAATYYELPRPGQKWSEWQVHPQPDAPDGKDCGHGRWHVMKRLDARYAPRSWWLWFVEYRGVIGESEEKVGVSELRLRRVRPEVLWRIARLGHLRGADLSGVNWSNAYLYNADLSSMDLRGSDLSNADLRNADLSGTNLSGAYLSGANLGDVNLSRAHLSDANFSSTNLRNANLSNASLYKTDLSGTNLSGACLRGAYLCGSNVYHANFRGADLSDADLRDVDVRRAYLYGANLSNADLDNENLSKSPKNG